MTREVWLQKARELEPLVAKYRDEGERERRLPTPVFEAMCEAGLYKLTLPSRFGGPDEPIGALADVAEELARYDGAVSWNLCIIAGTNMLAEYLSSEGAHEVFGAEPAYAAGSLAPKGKATRVEGGYRVSGRWQFGSGSAQANWFTATCQVTDGEPIVALVPRDQIQIIDTWYTAGLRGTGSNDIVIEDVFVPAERAVPLNMLTTGPGARALHPRRNLETRADAGP